MSCIPQFVPNISQVWGAKKENIERTPQVLSENTPSNLFVPIMLNRRLGCSYVVELMSTSIRKVKAEPEDPLKERALFFARTDRSIPVNLRLRKGTIKELDKGIFVKKTTDGVLELYLSEE